LHTAGKKREGKEQQRVRISGDVKRPPTFKDQAGDRPAYLRFTLHQQEGEQHRYTKVYTMRERALRYRDLQQGERVDVVGFAQTEERRQSDGSIRQAQVIYALGIKRVDGPRDR
jgi:hypothetical protein